MVPNQNKTRTESAQNLWLIKIPWTFDIYKNKNWIEKTEDKTWNIFFIQILEKKYKYCGGQNIENLLLS